MREPVLLILILLFTTGCKKGTGDTPVSAVTGSRRQLTLDSVYLYAQQTYLWNDALPNVATFNPRQYETTGAELNDYSREVYALSQLKINTATGTPFEKGLLNGSAKYSFISSTGLEGTAIAAVGLNDAGNDFGLSVAEYGSDDIRVAMVNPASPAALAGIARADRILSVNGTAIRAGMITWSTVLAQSQIEFSIQKLSGEIKQIKLTAASYQTSPILAEQVFDAGAVKTGYLALSRFSELNSVQSKLSECFGRFAQAQVTALIIDLRYNNGGYVETAEYLANLIAPSTLQGKVSYTAHYNTLMQQGKADILKNQPYLNAAGQQQLINGRKATYADIDFSVAGNTHYFDKKGSLNGITQVCFITSGTTASASELLINILKPYLPVKLIGSATYGKPVGYFRIGIDKYALYLSNFWLKNTSNNGDYFNGIPVDVKATDDVTHNFANVEESCIAASLATISGASTGVAKTQTSTAQIPNVSAVKIIGGEPLVNGLIENRLKLKTSNK